MLEYLELAPILTGMLCFFVEVYAYDHGCTVYYKDLSRESITSLS